MNCNVIFTVPDPTESSLVIPTEYRFLIIYFIVLIPKEYQCPLFLTQLLQCQRTDRRHMILWNREGLLLENWFIRRWMPTHVRNLSPDAISGHSSNHELSLVSHRRRYTRHDQKFSFPLLRPDWLLYILIGNCGAYYSFRRKEKKKTWQNLLLAFRE